MVLINIYFLSAIGLFILSDYKHFSSKCFVKVLKSNNLYEVTFWHLTLNLATWKV